MFAIVGTKESSTGLTHVMGRGKSSLGHGDKPVQIDCSSGGLADGLLPLKIGTRVMYCTVLCPVYWYVLYSSMYCTVECTGGEISSKLYCSLKLHFFLSFQQIDLVVRLLRGF